MYILSNLKLKRKLMPSLDKELKKFWWKIFKVKLIITIQSEKFYVMTGEGNQAVLQELMIENKIFKIFKLFPRETRWILKTNIDFSWWRERTNKRKTRIVKTKPSKSKFRLKTALSNQSFRLNTKTILDQDTRVQCLLTQPSDRWNNNQMTSNPTKVTWQTELRANSLSG